MSYLEKTLQPGETVIYQTRLHWIVYLPAVVLIAAGLWILLYTEIHVLDMPVTRYAGLIAIVLGAASWVLAWIRRISTEMAITNRRVIAKIGFVWRKTFEIDRQKVESVKVDQSILGRILDYGTVTVTGTGSSSEPVQNIDSPLEFRNKLLAS
ncbi:MAG: PH domain-containing protein [Alphaproteobacteria bacterium]